jgi:Glycosyl hydrolase catalytic core
MVSSLSCAATACCGLCPCDLPDEEAPTTSPAIGASLSPKRQQKASSQQSLPGKKGAAFIFRAAPGVPGSWTENLPKLKLLRPSWNYNWGPTRLAAQPDEIEFVPMIWTGNNLDKMQQILATEIEPHCRSGQVRFVLGFNEPDAAKQANMTVDVALERWSLLQAAVPDESVVLVSPSCAHPSEEWMQSFMNGIQSNGKRVDWVGVHWYGGASFPAFCAKMMEFHQLYQRPLLITEFAPADWSAKTVSDNRFSSSVVLAFMKQALPWLEAQDWIVGYAWFSFDMDSPAGNCSALFDRNGELTACGRYYASVSPSTPMGDQGITS